MNGGGRQRGSGLGWVILALLGVLVFVGNPLLTHFLVTYWWFGELGYTRVLVTEIAGSWALGLAGVVVSFTVMRLFCGMVAGIARRGGRAARYTGSTRRVLDLALLVVAAFLGQGLSNQWAEVGLLINSVPFHTADPILGADASFYVFALPVLQDLLGWLGGVLVATLVAALTLLYVLDLSGRVNNVLEPYITATRSGSPLSGNGPDGPAGPLRPASFDIRWLRPYLSVVSLWLALLFVLLTVSNWLSRYDTLVQPGSPHFFGAGYTATHATIPGLLAMSIVSALGAVALLVNGLAWKRWSTVALVPLVWLAAWALLTLLLPGAINLLVVRPAESNAEAPYIANNIAGTLAGFGLQSVRTLDFPVQPLAANAVQRNRATIDSLRVLDADPFKTASKQKQEIRTYYDFGNVDIDRYRVGANLRQVLLATREINTQQLPDQAKTWQNLNFTYTHGYGVVVSPVNKVDTDGSPLYWIKDIPPRANTAAGSEAAELPPVRRPEIYFGTETNNSVFVDTKANEFDRSQGDRDYTTHYAGKAGITIGGFLKRLVWISYFNSPVQVGTSSNLTASSRVLLYRNVRDRVARIAPFFTYDSDPYIVLNDDGRLTWMLDAYTSSSNYPYSEPNADTGENYLRNSVKVTIDPYNGTVRFYLADAHDAIARSYGRLFPGLLRPLSEMPADLQRHIRVPQTIFDIQSAVYTKYHMSDPLQFYNQEDMWGLPAAGDASGGGSDALPIESYYTVMGLPNSPSEEFVLTRSFVPLAKPNMIALLVARCDPPHYGELVLYRFPSNTQVPGPVQFTARINQTPQISEKVTLWSQQGSKVQWGNVIIVPIDRGLLYLQPLYLQATNSPIPQLQWVVVSANNKLAWDTSLDGALNSLFGGTTAPPGPGTSGAGGAPVGPGQGRGPVSPATRAALVDINRHFTAAQKALAGGDYLTYGREMDAVQRLIKAALAAPTAAPGKT